MMDAPWVDEATIQQPRTPRELEDFVRHVHREVAAIPEERHKGMMKKGIYKVFLDEIVPLSQFAALHYLEDIQIKPVLGNQAHDALVLDKSGAVVGKIEMTAPQDGAAVANDSKLAVDRGFGNLSCYGPGEEIANLSRFIVDTARKKAKKDYSDCVLVIVISTLPPFDSFKSAHDMQIERVLKELQSIQFKAQKVFLLISPVKLVRIHG
jgi:hypothetical protein